MEQNPPQVWRLRPDLEFSPQQHQGKSFVVVKDPLTGRYFRFTQSQATILNSLREPTDIASLSSSASDQLATSISTETIAAFLNSLEEKWLLDTTVVREKLATVQSHKL